MKLIHHFVTLSLAVIMTVTIFTLPAAAATSEQQEAAERLHALGLFQGTGNDVNGNPIFDLDKTPTRAQATIMLVRLLGKEESAQAGTWKVPFTDVSDSLKPYVGYVYQAGLSNGKTATSYGSSDKITAAQYITFVLRALGYDSKEDFTVNTACDFATEIGLTAGEYSNNTINFSRGDVAEISYNALSVSVNETRDSLAKTCGISLDINNYSSWSEEEQDGYKYFKALWAIQPAKQDEKSRQTSPLFVLTYDGWDSAYELTSKLQFYTKQDIGRYLMRWANELRTSSNVKQLGFEASIYDEGEKINLIGFSIPFEQPQGFSLTLYYEN